MLFKSGFCLAAEKHIRKKAQENQHLEVKIQEQSTDRTN